MSPKLLKYIIKFVISKRDGSVIEVILGRLSFSSDPPEVK